MGQFGGFYKGEKKKKKRKDQDTRVKQHISQESVFIPSVEIIKKGKK